jgi:hypothetical protein
MTELHLKKEWLIKDAIASGLTQSTDPKEAEKEYRCHNCKDESKCRFAWDAYNIGDDWCLAEK